MHAPSPMTDDAWEGPAAELAAQRSPIEGGLRRLVARERSLLRAIALLQLLAAVGGLALLASALASAGAGRTFALLALALLAAVSIGAALAWPLLPRWRSSGDRLAQARRVEALRPELRGRLITALQRADLAPPPPDVQPIPLSVPLLLRATRTARAVLDGVDPVEVHPTRILRPRLSAVAATWLLVLAASLFAPIAPLRAVTAIVRGELAQARLEEGAALSEDRALVGDITLLYRFPDYMQVEPVEVPNSDGTIHAPPGTRVRVRARTAERFDAAAIQVDDQRPRDIELQGGRDLLAELEITGGGTWRFLLFRGKEAIPSADFAIVVEADTPPVVQVEVPRESVAVDAPLGLSWQAEDDFGIQRVLIEVERDGRTEEVELRQPLDAPRTLQGMLRMSPRELGLAVGSRARLRVVAIDNDLTTGGNRGESAWLEVEVLGPQAASQRLGRYYAELRNALLIVLADFLVEESSLPIANDPSAMTRWVEVARGRFDPVRAILQRQWGEELPATVEGEKVRAVLDDAAVLFRFTLTTFEPGSARRVTLGDLETFDTLHNTEIERLEDAILLLDRLLQMEAMGQVGEMASRLSAEAKALQAMAQTADAQEILARLDQLSRVMEQFARAQARLAEGQLREFLNARLDSAASLQAEIRKALAEGRIEDARAMLEELARQVQQLAEGVEDLARQVEAQQDQLGEQMSQAIQQLEQLERDQRAVAAALQEAQRAEGGAMQEQVDLWLQLDRLAGSAQAQARAAAEAGGDGRGYRTDTLRRQERAREAVEGLRDAVRARDPAVSVERARQAQSKASQASAALSSERDRPRLDSDPVPSSLERAAEANRELRGTLDQIARLLEQLARQERQMSPELARKTREMASQQSELKERQEQLAREVRQIERQNPDARGRAGQAMERAGESMEQARQALGEGRPEAGQGQMEDAADRLRDAADELRDQQQQMERERQASQGAGAGNRPERDGSEEMARQSQPMIPAPEQFRTPEEYRRALLEGMEAAVPEEFRAGNRRYYEELVRQ